LGGAGGGGAAGMGGAAGAAPVPPAPARVINMTPARFFPEGVTVDKKGNFYVGSMELGVIYKGTADNPTAAPFIPTGSNGLVSPLGLYADDATNTLWVCSSDTGNGPRRGPVSIKTFDLTTGTPGASFAWPAPTGTMIPDTTANGFCNDLTVDADGNVYATDSWYSRIVKLPKGGTVLQQWVADPVLGSGQWHLNGIDVDQSSSSVFVVDQGTDAQSGKLFRIPITGTGAAGTITEITFPARLKHPDGLKVIAPNLLAMGEAAGGVSTIKLTNNTGIVTNVISGLRGAATLALYQASAWVVEGQGDHYWDSAVAGPNANPPFRLMEIPLTVGAGRTNISITTPRFFPEGVTVDTAGNFYVGSMDLGSIQKVAAGTTTPAPFIAAGTNGLVSVIGLYAHTASNTLWVCSSDAGNGQLKGSAPVALKAFNLTSGAARASYEWPAPTTTTPVYSPTVHGFCNDITMDAAGNVYATDSWYPRILRLAAGGTALTQWVTSPIFPQTQWHLNGIDIDPAGANLYVVENHPGALYRVAIATNGAAGTVTAITTQRPVFGPDGLKVINPTTLAIAEGSGGMAIVDLTGNTGRVRSVSTGFDGVATFALWAGAAWLVENQGDHFWSPTDPNGPTATKPFRLVETPLMP
jgi:sugar lactone lactonase YvrE